MRTVKMCRQPYTFRVQLSIAGLHKIKRPSPHPHRLAHAAHSGTLCPRHAVLCCGVSGGPMMCVCSSQITCSRAWGSGKPHPGTPGTAQRVIALYRPPDNCVKQTRGGGGRSCHCCSGDLKHCVQMMCWQHGIGYRVQIGWCHRDG